MTHIFLFQNFSPSHYDIFEDSMDSNRSARLTAGAIQMPIVKKSLSDFN